MNETETKTESSESIHLTEFQIKWMRRVLFVLLIAACYFVVYAAWMDLYNPGSQLARDYQNYATVTLIGMAVLALPLWYVKFDKLQKWKDSMSSVDDPLLKRKMWWESMKPYIKPALKQIVFIAVMVVIFYYLINTYFHIPQSVISNYVNYYTVHRYSGQR